MRVIAEPGFAAAGVVAAVLMTFATPASAVPAATGAGTIATVAGGVGGPARATTVALAPTGVLYHAGQVYVTDGVVQAVSTATDHLAPVAGAVDAALPQVGDGVLADDTSLDAWDATYDPAGNLVIADTADSRIRVVAATAGTFYGQPMKAGYIYTVAGSGCVGPDGDGGPARQACLNDPRHVLVDGAGNLVIADTDNYRVRVVAASTGTFYGIAMKARDIYTVAGHGHSGPLGDGGPATDAEVNPEGLTLDGAGNLVIADSEDGRVRVVAVQSGKFYGVPMKAGHIYTVAGDGPAAAPGNGGPARQAGMVPEDVAFDGSGNLVVTDAHNDQVRVVALRTGTFYGQSMTAGDIYSVAGTGTAGFSGDGGPASQASLNDPEGVTVDASGNLVVADAGNHRVRVVAAATGTDYGQPMTAGDVYTVAGTGAVSYSGDGGPATSAEFSDPGQVAVDAAGNVVVSDSGNARVRVDAAQAGTYYGVAMKAGDVYTVAGTGTAGFAGNGGPATKAELSAPQAVAVDGAGNLVVADAGNDRVRVVAVKTGTFYGVAMTAGDIYTVAGDGLAGFSGDGGPGPKAKLAQPTGVAVDGAGNLVVADAGNDRIRVVAAATGTFYGQPMTAGDIYTVAGTGTGGYSGDGGPALGAELHGPQSVAVDGSGNLVIADSVNARIRMVAARTAKFYGQKMTARDIYTVAGTGTAGFSGDGGPATSAEFGVVPGVAVDGAGNLAVADVDNDRVRVVAAKTGSFYGQPMTVGDVYTVAGDGIVGFSGDGGPAAKARLCYPSGVAADGSGDLLIADSDSPRIRMITG